MLRLGAAVLALGLASGTAAAAQQIRTVYSPSQLREDHGAALSRYVRTLAESPRNLSALIGAGEAALALGDPKTALTFFARAEEVAPRDGRVKAGMGSAFVLMEQPVAALRFFGEAESFGIPAHRFAGDRGLAYDLTGDPRRAQADYRLALSRGEDAEIRQRLALSLAITGDREGALEAIEALVRDQNRSAWRTRAFILALTGDTAGATEATRAVMPAQAAAMKPFYAQLPWLTPAERAMAVHFGRFPEDGADRSAASAAGAQAAAGTRYAGAASAIDAGRPDAAQTPLGRGEPAPASNAPRRRPAAAARTATDRARPDRASARERPARTAAAQPREARPAPVRAQSRSEEEAEPSDPGPKPAFSAEIAAAAELPPAPAPKPKPESAEPVAAPAEAPPQVVRLPFGPPTPGTPPRLADIREAVASIPRPGDSGADAAADEAAVPARHWVQIAGGANKEALPREFDRLKDRAPELLSDKTAWTAPLRFTNRLLVGPFDSEGAAQAFVNRLAAKELSAFSWTSEEGQEIEKLSAR